MNDVILLSDALTDLLVELDRRYTTNLILAEKRAREKFRYEHTHAALTDWVDTRERLDGPE